MSVCEQWRDAVEAAALGGLSESSRSDLDRHLIECSHCIEELRVLEEVLAQVRNHHPTMSGEELQLYTRLEARLDAIDEESRTIRVGREPKDLGFRGIAWAAVILVSVGLFLGLWQQRTQDSQPVGADVASHTELDDLLEDALPWLLAVANSDGETALVALDDAKIRRRTQQLVERAESLSESLSRVGDRRRSQMVRDLGRVLQQLSNTPGENPGLRLQRARSALQESALLFQVGADQMLSL